MKYKITLEGKMYIIEHELKTLKKAVIIIGVSLVILTVAFIINL